MTATASSPLSWHSTGLLNGVPIKAWMRSPRSSIIFDTTKDLPLTLVVGVGNEVSMVQTVIDRKAPDTLAATLVISGQRMDPKSVNFSELESPLGEYEFRSNVTWNKGELKFSDLEARVGASQASGQVNIHREETRYRFDILLNSPFLETEDLVQWAKNRREASQQLSPESPKKTIAQTPGDGIFSGIVRQIEELTRENIFDIRVNIEELHSAGILLGKVKTELFMDENDVHLDPMQIKLPGGNVDAKYRSRKTGNGLETTLNVHIESLQYGGLLRLFNPESEARGRLYLDTALTSISLI